MRFSFLATLALLAFSSSLCAQSIAPAEKSDPQAKVLLDKVRKKYEAYKTVEAGFSLSIELPGQPKQTQKGTISQDGSKFRLDMDDQIVASDGKTTWIFVKQNKEIQITDADPNEASGSGFMTPKELLNRYQKGDYLYAITDKVTESNVVLTQVEFKPKAKNSEYSKMRLSIDEKSSSIKSIKAFAKDGGRFTFTLGTLKTNKAFPSGHFALNASQFPGVKVVDLRM
jgi:outer membrane lipoprotein carrier protein